MALLNEVATERRNLSPAALYEEAIHRGEAAVVSTGALTAETGKHTGRSPKDKFFVKEPTTEGRIWWGGNRPIAPDKFDRLLQKMVDFVSEN
ncbi:MAG TPA: phosphoenolpyruvate carboxykinase (ATP), partial [Candidatus Dormibacteraeota bacterium]|nr:phosphoenolpyruvate carboxykinase (ATP) [Candidatus Dormibacteraeota bacterium]